MTMELASSNDRGGQAPALREKNATLTVVRKNVTLTVGRGPVPRHATIAGDRPPRYGDVETRRSLLPEESRPGGLSYRNALKI